MTVSSGAGEALPETAGWCNARPTWQTLWGRRRCPSQSADTIPRPKLSEDGLRMQPAPGRQIRPWIRPRDTAWQEVETVAAAAKAAGEESRKVCCP